MQELLVGRWGKMTCIGPSGVVHVWASFVAVLVGHPGTLGR